MGWLLSRAVTDFAPAVTPLLEADPVEHTVGLTLLAALLEAADTTDPGDAPGSLFGWYVPGPPGGGDERTGASGAVLMTPPYPLLLAAVPRGSERELAAVLRREGVEVTGASGRPEAVERFSAELAVLGAFTPRIRMRQRLYALDQLALPTVPGAPRRGAAPDAPLLTSWYEEFCTETGSREVDHAADVALRLADGAVWLWEDPVGIPVSFAARRPVVARTARVGPVYTPPAHRGRGYAMAVTAVCTQAALDDGANHVVLFTDLANPTSNALYQRIGYRPCSDRLVVRFEPEAGDG